MFKYKRKSKNVPDNNKLFLSSVSNCCSIFPTEALSLIEIAAPYATDQISNVYRRFHAHFKIENEMVCIIIKRKMFFLGNFSIFVYIFSLSLKENMHTESKHCPKRHIQSKPAKKYLTQYSIVSSPCSISPPSNYMNLLIHVI